IIYNLFIFVYFFTHHAIAKVLSCNKKKNKAKYVQLRSVDNAFFRLTSNEGMECGTESNNLYKLSKYRQTHKKEGSTPKMMAQTKQNV
ncbi:hypothetical protein M5D96_007151, partial [Drosophila gunungcola]